MVDDDSDDERDADGLGPIRDLLGGVSTARLEMEDIARRVVRAEIREAFKNNGFDPSKSAENIVLLSQLRSARRGVYAFLLALLGGAGATLWAWLSAHITIGAPRP